MIIKRVTIGPEAETILNQLKNQYGALLFHQSGGCCDGSQPMCFEVGDFKIGSSDVCLGKVSECEFWMSRDQYEYWKHTQLHIHIVEGRGSSFSLEIPLGYRFITQSRLFTDEELKHLEPVTYLED